MSERDREREREREIKLLLYRAVCTPQSPWHQYFQDEELKRIIQTDVVRTFPDELYFAQDYVR